MRRPNPSAARDRWKAIVRFAVDATATLAALGGVISLLTWVDPIFDLAANFSPFLLLFSLLVLFLSLRLRRGATVVFLAAAGIAAPTSLMLPDAVGAVRQMAPTRAGQSIKVISANLYSYNGDQAPIETLIHREDPDIILLQEAYGDWGAMLDRLSATYPTKGGCKLPHECSTVVLSKFPAVAELAHETSAIMILQLALPDRLGGRTMEVASVHLSRPPPMDAHISELHALGARSVFMSSRAIVAGDLNATPWTSSLRYLDRVLPLERHTRALFSWPALV